VLARAHRGERLQRWLAAWIAAFLVLAPAARPSLPLDLADAAPQAPVASRDAQGQHPAAGLSSAEPVTLGILSRPALVETTLWLPPVKLPALRPAAHKPLPARGGALVLGGEPRAAFQRSSVGTARTPTGPPA
jgi:hypothetical protein